MANFATHAVGGAVFGGCAALFGCLQGALTLPWAGVMWCATFAASLAPDLDARSSIPARWLWDGVATACFCWCVLCVPLHELDATRVFAGAACGLFVRGPLSRFMMRWTRHRGLFHSVQVALLFGVGVGLALDRLTDATAMVQLWIGSAVALGFVLHLLLDEAFSVDINNARLRRSFGSALKIWDARCPGLSAGLSLACLLSVAVFAVRFL